MNRKGQTLIAFVILLPLFLCFLAFIVDTAYMLKESTKLASTTKTILKTMYDQKDNEDFDKEIITLYEKNNIPVQNIEIKKNAYSVQIFNQYKIKSIFGQIIGLKEYKIKIKMQAVMQDDTLKIIKE